MFTGIITHFGHIEGLEKREGLTRLWVRPDFDMADLMIGASVAHNGVCLTVVEKTAQAYGVDVGPETLKVTKIGGWQVGQKINLERALKMGDELGGHMVSGHVDGLATLLGICPEGDCYRLGFQVPEPLHRFIAPKGSVALDGVSLTVNQVKDRDFSVSIIPHTWSHTTLGALKQGDTVNIEIDLMARYAARYHETV